MKIPTTQAFRRFYRQLHNHSPCRRINRDHRHSSNSNSNSNKALDDSSPKAMHPLRSRCMFSLLPVAPRSQRSVLVLHLSSHSLTEFCMPINPLRSAPASAHHIKITQPTPAQIAQDMEVMPVCMLQHRPIEQVRSIVSLMPGVHRMCQRGWSH